MSKRLVAVCAAALLVVAGCSDAPEEPTPGAAGASEEPTEAGRKGERGERSRKQDRDDRKNKGEPSRSKEEGSADRAGGGGGKSGGGSSDSGGSGGSDAVAAYPAAGTYVFEQEGYEEFCQTTSCEREDLPREQSIKMALRDRSGSRAVIISEARSSGKRLTRTTFVFTSKAALITDVYTRFDYQNVSFEDSY